VPVTVRRNALAKRLILRVSKTTGEIKLTLPMRASKRSAERFLNSHIDWLLSERSAVEPTSVLSDGDTVFFMGDAQTLSFTGEPPRTVRHEGEMITVGGPADLAGKRLENWFRRQAKTVLEERVRFHSETLGVQHSRIGIGDMKSRWGSCSSTGGLKFNWRLVMAPFEVLDYVTAHEVAHLLEMNHSEYFWRHVDRCVPDHKVWRKWLKQEGNELFRVSF